VGEQERTHQMKAMLEAERLHRSSRFLRSESDHDLCQQVEDQRRVDFHHDPILGTRDQLLDMEEMFQGVEKDFYGPSLPIQVIDHLGGEGTLEDIGEVEVPRFFVEETHQADLVLVAGFWGFGELHRYIQLFFPLQKVQDF